MANQPLRLATRKSQIVNRMSHEDSPSADENERQALKLRFESALGAEQGGSWRVDIIAGRYGWYVRPVRLRTRTQVKTAAAGTR